MKTTAICTCLLAWLIAAGPAQTQTQQAPASPSATPAAPSATPAAARPNDVDSIEHIIGAVYDVISGPAGTPRDWDRFRSLFYPGARLIPTRRDDKGVGIARVLT